MSMAKKHYLPPVSYPFVITPEPFMQLSFSDDDELVVGGNGPNEAEENEGGAVKTYTLDWDE